MVKRKKKKKYNAKQQKQHILMLTKSKLRNGGLILNKDMILERMKFHHYTYQSKHQELKTYQHNDFLHEKYVKS